MVKYSEKDKRNAVNLIKEKHYSIRETAKELNICKSSIGRWWRSYDVHGEESFSFKRKVYSGEFKLEVVKYMQRTKLPVEHVSTMFKIPASTTILNWENIYIEKGEAGLLLKNQKKLEGTYMNSDNKKECNISKDKDALIKENKTLRAENAYLKKSIALRRETRKSKVEKRQR